MLKTRTLSSISLSVRGTIFDAEGAGGCNSWLNRLVVAAYPPTDGRGTRDEFDELGRVIGALLLCAIDGRPPLDGPDGIERTAEGSFGAACCTAAK
jgi:hypothetical protein